MTGVYIHIPFCRRKCPYCDFYSVTADDGLREQYVNALCRNILYFKGRGISADTVYFGGGTPSLLSAGQIGLILTSCGEAFSLKEPEITLECNPCTVSFEKLRDYRSLGVNRLSFGIQSAQDEELRFLGRLHDFSSAKNAVLAAQKAGFENISGDIMLGLAGQTMESLEKTLEDMCALPLSHISAYMLKIEEGTPFDCDGVKSSVAGEELLCDMYLRTAEILEEKGFEQYEISNFAKDKKYSRHNLKYWQCEEYLGFGAAAHSFFGGERYFCRGDISEYIFFPVQPKDVLENHPDRAEEYIMLGLRLKWGIDLNEVSRLCSSRAAEKIAQKARLYSRNGLCRIENGRVCLTPRGFLVSNDIISEFICCIE